MLLSIILWGRDFSWIFLNLKQNEKAFFIHGFSKNAKDNIDSKEKEIYKELAGILLNADASTLANMIEMGSLIEVKQYE